LSHDPAERSSTATRWDDSSSLMHKQSSLWCFFMDFTKSFSRWRRSMCL